MCLPVISSLSFRYFIKRSYCTTYNYYSTFNNRNGNLYDSKQRTKHLLQYSQKRHLSAEAVKNWYSNLFKTVTESDTVAFFKDGLVFVHDVTGLHWGGTIILTTLGLRLILTFPLGVYQSFVVARLELARIEMAGIVEELKKETAVAIKRFNWSQKEARKVYNYSVKKQWRLLLERDNCHPFKTSLVVLIQLPVWVILSLALRAMAYKYGQDPAASEIIADQLAADGVGWLSNLLLPDSTGVLPLTVCLTNLCIIELQSCSKPNQSRAQRIITHIFRAFALVSFPIALSVPSGAIAKHDILCDVPSIYGVVPANQWHAYTITSKPGLILVRNPFTAKGQKYWTIKCLQDFTRKPNLRNTDIDNDLKDVDQLWEHCQRSNLCLDRLRWATLGYHHNWDTKVYSEDRRGAFPGDLHALSQHFAKVLGYPQFDAQAAIVNFYHPGTCLSGHVDRSEVDLDAPLFSFSFGQSAIFLIGGSTLDEDGLPILLQSGDLLLMTREARLCYHAVPRILSDTSSCPPWMQDDLFDQGSAQHFDQNLIKVLEDQKFWDPFEKYVSRSRININVRQVLPEGQFSIV